MNEDIPLSIEYVPINIFESFGIDTDDVFYVNSLDSIIVYLDNWNMRAIITAADSWNVDVEEYNETNDWWIATGTESFATVEEAVEYVSGLPDLR